MNHYSQWHNPPQFYEALKPKKKDIDAKVRAKLRYINKNFPQNITKYEKQEVILGERNSYSKTDTDATFIRMKEDHMLNGQLKAAYNVPISTSNQYMVNYTVHHNPTDTITLAMHLAQHEASFGKSPSVLTAMQDMVHKKTTL